MNREYDLVMINTEDLRKAWGLIEFKPEFCKAHGIPAGSIRSVASRGHCCRSTATRIANALDIPLDSLITGDYIKEAEPVRKNIGAAIADWLIDRRADQIGIPSKRLKEILEDNPGPNLNELIAIAKATGLSLDELLLVEDTDEEDLPWN